MIVLQKPRCTPHVPSLPHNSGVLTALLALSRPVVFSRVSACLCVFMRFGISKWRLETCHPGPSRLVHKMQHGTFHMRCSFKLLLFLVVFSLVCNLSALFWLSFPSHCASEDLRGETGVCVYIWYMCTFSRVGFSIYYFMNTDIGYLGGCTCVCAV